MQITDFDYYLPVELIAQQPQEPRDSSRLLVLDRQTAKIEHQKFRNLLDYVRAGDTLVFNDTKVIPARLLGTRSDSGGKVEVFLLYEVESGLWEVLVKPGKRARIGSTITFSAELSCEIVANTDFGGRLARFYYQGNFSEILDRLGQTPLPPYIHAPLLERERYQTIYANCSGSAAAPTAGLHFTTELLAALKLRGVNLAFITLHVGLGTFRPVAVDNIQEHVMHREYYHVSSEAANIIQATKQQGGRIFAVGTTAVRTLETAVQADGCLMAGEGWTEAFIYPGYKFKLVDAIVTNFHLPKSTLLMLVSAFAGRERILGAYQAAIEQRYRFFSFGDAMLLL